jgi:hypothetical protein
MVLFSEHNFSLPSFAPLSYITFTKYFLILHVAVHLIANDKNIDLEGAWELMVKSEEHGEALNPLQDNDEILEEIFQNNVKRRVQVRKLEEQNKDVCSYL